MLPIDDNFGYEVEFSVAFDAWLLALRDKKAVALITRRLEGLQVGLWGDAKSLGDGVTEMRIHFGPGYRLYATQVGRRVVLMLGVGDKSTQRRDIEAAKILAKDYDDGD